MPGTYGQRTWNMGTAITAINASGRRASSLASASAFIRAHG
jgi:hypothetical protein